MVYYTLHLFAGAGGGILADLLHGFKTIGAVEIDEYARNVLLSRQADGQLPEFPIWDDVTTFRRDNPDTREFIDRLRQISDRLIIAGGFPCQDISGAGKGKGIRDGERSGLWREYARIISEIRPAYVFVENSPFIVRRGLDLVLSQLAEMRYNAEWLCLSASQCGAQHKRERFWLLATNTDSNSKRELQQEGLQCDKRRWTCDICEDLSNANIGWIERRSTCSTENRWDVPNTYNSRDWRGEREQSESSDFGLVERGGKAVNAVGRRRNFESRLGGVSDGLADWMDEVKSGTFWRSDEKEIPRIVEKCDNRRKRLKCLGNGQVPVCAYRAFLTNLEKVLQ